MKQVSHRCTARLAPLPTPSAAGLKKYQYHKWSAQLALPLPSTAAARHVINGSSPGYQGVMENTYVFFSLPHVPSLALRELSATQQHGGRRRRGLHTIPRTQPAFTPSSSSAAFPPPGLSFLAPLTCGENEVHGVFVHSSPGRVYENVRRVSYFP